MKLYATTFVSLICIASCSYADAQNANGIASQSSLYVVDGLPLGGQVRFDSEVYRSYKCVPSEQFAGFTWCQKKVDERVKRGQFTSSYSILHSQAGAALYINRYLEPAWFSGNEANDDINGRSKKFGAPARIIPMPQQSSVPNGKIVTWGNLILEPLDPTTTSELAAGHDVHVGFMIDHIGDFQRSAQQGLPIYRLTGGAGYVWAASWDNNGVGTLRFLTIDPSVLSPQASLMTAQDRSGKKIAEAEAYGVSSDGKNADAQHQNPYPRILSQNKREDPGLRNEWARVSPAEQACIDESLKPQGLNTLALRQQGIYPADTRLMRIRQACSIGLTVQQFDERQAKAAQEEERIKAQKAADAAEAQAQRDQRLAKIRERRDPSDVIAQVLNYSSGLPDEGTEFEFWYQQGTRCMYHLYENNPDVLMRAQINAVLGALVGQKQSDIDDISIDLNDMDARLIAFSNEYSELVPDNQNTRTLYGQNIPQQKPITVVRYDGKVLFTAAGTLPIERLQRGWGLIYEKYCRGKQKAF